MQLLEFMLGDVHKVVAINDKHLPASYEICRAYPVAFFLPVLKSDLEQRVI